MRGKLLVTTGMVAGFMLGSWTPLGQVISIDTVHRTLFSIAQTSSEQSTAAVQAATLGRFRTLIAAAHKEPTGNILQNQGIIMAGWSCDWLYLIAGSRHSRSTHRHTPLPIHPQTTEQSGNCFNE